MDKVNHMFVRFLINYTMAILCSIVSFFTKANAGILLYGDVRTDKASIRKLELRSGSIVP